VADSQLKPRQTPWTRIAWVGVAIGIIARFVGLGAKSLWFDEGYTAWMVTHPVKEIIRLVRADTAPPLYYILLRGWTEVFGHSEAGLRSISAVCSALTILLVFAIARRMLPNPAAVAGAVWLLVLGFHQQYFAQEARAYALMALLFAAAVYCVQRHLMEQHRRWLIPLVPIIAASLYTHNMMAFFIAALGLFWLLLPSSHSIKRRFADGIVVAIAAAALFLPWAIYSLPSQLRMVNASFWIERPTFANLGLILNWIAGVPRPDELNSVIYSLHSPHALGSAPMWFGPILILVVIFSIRRREQAALLVLLLFAPATVAIYSLLRTSILMDKIFLPSATLMPVFLMIPLASLLSPRPDFGELSRAVLRERVRVRAEILPCVWIAILLLIAAAAFAQYWITPKNEDWRHAAALVQELSPARRLIIFVANDGQSPFDYYYRYRAGESATGAPAGFLERDPPKTMLRVQSADDLQDLQSRIETEHYQEVVLVQSHEAWADPDGRVLEMFRELFPSERRQDVYYVSVFQFDR
jgi:4-amino-4-deoxy-L-arabinose transferase-like glycosyltransferase